MWRDVIRWRFWCLRDVDLFQMVRQSIDQRIELRQLLLLSINLITEFEYCVIGERETRFQIIDPHVGFRVRL